MAMVSITGGLKVTHISLGCEYFLNIFYIFCVMCQFGMAYAHTFHVYIFRSVMEMCKFLSNIHDSNFDINPAQE